MNFLIIPKGKRTDGQGNTESSKYSIIEGKSFDSTHFLDEIFSMLEFQGLLEQFLLIDEAVFPKLVKEFYQNMVVKQIKGSIVIKLYVRKVKICLNHPKLAKLFQLQLTWITTYSREYWIETSKVGCHKYLEYMLNRTEDIYVDTRPLKYELTSE